MIELTNYEKSLTEADLFMKWLMENRVNFVELSDRYVRFLENEKLNSRTQASRYRDLLAQHLEYESLPKEREWVADKTIGMLSAYKEFETAPIKEKWEEIIEAKGINTDLSTLDFEVYK